MERERVSEMTDFVTSWDVRRQSFIAPTFSSEHHETPRRRAPLLPLTQNDETLNRGVEMPSPHGIHRYLLSRDGGTRVPVLVKYSLICPVLSGGRSRRL